MRKIYFAIICFIVWVLLTWNFGWQELTMGVVVSLFVSLFFGDKFLGIKIFSPVRIGWMLYYIPIWIYYCIVANIDVAKRVLRPKMLIKPGIVKIRTNLKTDLGKVMLANSITMTPGTMTVDILGDELYIHWIYVSTEQEVEATKIIASAFEKILKHIFE
ncbi:MAG: Na+/H+ antiporter subunit E [bacterium]|nr:Na+/H+ antiporter subunit E [bacterium]